MNANAPIEIPQTFGSHYATLQHWRGLAALMVFFHHATPVRETMSYPLQGAIESITRYGWFGIHLFFVLSGYCIASNVYGLVQTGQQPLDFLRNRLLRIYPAYWATCLAVIAMGLIYALVCGADWHKSLPPNLTAAIAHILLIEPYFGLDPFLVVSWTLVYEVGFYILVTLGFWLYRMGCRLNLLIDIGLGLALLGLLHAHLRPFYVLSMWNEFVMGGMVFMALYYQKFSRFHARLCLAAIVGLAAAGWLLSTHQYATLSTITAAFGLLLYFLHRWDKYLLQSLWLKPLCWIGAFSYSLYLFHSPLISRMQRIAHFLVGDQATHYWLIQLIIWSGCLLGCWIFHLICERPLETWRRRLKPAEGIRDNLILG